MSLFSKKHRTVTPHRRTSPPQQTAQETTTGGAFRRNRTLTGSISSNVASPNEAKAQLKSARVQTHELATRRRRIGGMLLLALLGCGVFFGLIWQFTAGVRVVAVGVAVPDTTRYEQAIQSYFSTRPIERLRFLIDTDHLNEYMQSETPEVAIVRIGGATGFGTSAFRIEMRRPIASWSVNNRQQYVDTTGTAFERNYFASPSVQIVDNSGVRVQAGQAITSNRFLGFVGRAVGLAKVQGYSVQQVIIPADTTRSVELRLEGVAYPIKLSVDRPAGEQAEDMSRAIQWLARQGRVPEYLDVRVSGEAFYR
jgi:hypothetical protein